MESFCSFVYLETDIGLKKTIIRVLKFCAKWPISFGIKEARNFRIKFCAFISFLFVFIMEALLIFNQDMSQTKQTFENYLKAVDILAKRLMRLIKQSRKWRQFCDFCGHFLEIKNKFQEVIQARPAVQRNKIWVGFSHLPFCFFEFLCPMKN